MHRIFRASLALCVAILLPRTSPAEPSTSKPSPEAEAPTQAEPESSPEPSDPTASLAHYQPLFDNSPFLTPEFRERIARTRSAGAREFVFHGYIKLDDDWLFCIYHRKNNLAHWIKLNDTLEGYTLTSFNQEAQTVQFAQGSLKFNLTLDQPK